MLSPYSIAIVFESNDPKRVTAVAAHLKSRDVDYRIVPLINGNECVIAYGAYDYDEMRARCAEVANSLPA